MRPFLKHQEAAFRFTMKVTHPFLAMAMRTGKTLVAIRIALARLGSGATVLTVAPKPVLEAWERELKAESVPYRLLLGSQPERLAALDSLRAGFFLINPEGLLACEWMWDLHFDGVILDESTVCRNPGAQIVEVLCRHFRGAKMRMCLSGNPAPEGPIDWFFQMKFLWGKFLGADNYFKFRSILFRLIGYDWCPKGGALEKILFALKGRVYFLSAKQAGVFLPMVYQRRYVDLPAELRKKYREMEYGFTTTIQNQTLETSWVPVKIMRLAQIASGWGGAYQHKIKELIALLEGDLARVSVVVWHRFTRDIDSCALALGIVGIDAGILDGRKSYEENKVVLDAWRLGKFRVLLVQIKLGRRGLDLSTAEVAIFFSNSYSADDRDQAVARIQHPFRKTTPLTIDLIARNTVDEDILDALADKRATSRVFFSRILDKIARRINGIAPTLDLRTHSRNTVRFVFPKRNP